MIELKNIEKKLDKIDIKIDLSIKEGIIFGIVGESGSGKSTILRILNQILKADRGEINLNSLDKMSMVFQDYNLLENLNVFDNVALPLKIEKLEKNKIKEKVLEALEFVDLLDKKETYPSILSGGQKQRVSIARAIVSKPDILLCDEPTSSLDKSTTNEIVKLFLKINKKFKTTIIVVSHELDIIKAMCDRAIILEKGRVVDEFDIDKDEAYLDTKKNFIKYAKEVLK